MTSELLRQLRRDEGLRLKPYHDTTGHLTIGYGINLDAGIDEEEAEYLLDKRARAAARAVDRQWPWARTLSQPRFGVLCNMVYQMGPSGVAEFRRMLAALHVGDYELAATEMLDSKWAREDSPARAERLAEQMRLNQWV